VTEDVAGERVDCVLWCARDEFIEEPAAKAATAISLGEVERDHDRAVVGGAG